MFDKGLNGAHSLKFYSAPPGGIKALRKLVPSIEQLNNKKIRTRAIKILKTKTQQKKLTRDKHVGVRYKWLHACIQTIDYVYVLREKEEFKKTSEIKPART